jgi:hypothetical protein
VSSHVSWLDNDTVQSGTTKYIVSNYTSKVNFTLEQAMGVQKGVEI